MWLRAFQSEDNDNEDNDGKFLSKWFDGIIAPNTIKSITIEEEEVDEEDKNKRYEACENDASEN